jgi:hypothetical protein
MRKKWRFCANLGKGLDEKNDKKRSDRKRRKGRTRHRCKPFWDERTTTQIRSTGGENVGVSTRFSFLNALDNDGGRKKSPSPRAKPRKKKISRN